MKIPTPEESNKLIVFGDEELENNHPMAPLPSDEYSFSQGTHIL